MTRCKMATEGISNNECAEVLHWMHWAYSRFNIKKMNRNPEINLRVILFRNLENWIVLQKMLWKIESHFIYARPCAKFWCDLTCRVLRAPRLRDSPDISPLFSVLLQLEILSSESEKNHTVWRVWHAIRLFKNDHHTGQEKHHNR